MKKIELELYSAFDQVICITKFDGADIKNLDPDRLQNKTHHVNFVTSPWDNPKGLVDSSSGSRIINPWSERKDLVFVGNGKKSDNIFLIWSRF